MQKSKLPGYFSTFFSIPALLYTGLGPFIYLLILTYLGPALDAHEDAYILFRYANNLSQGFGIVFNQAGPPAEGATDFLWLCLISAFSSILQITPYSAAHLLNAGGLSLIGFCFYQIAISSLEQQKLKFYSGLFLLSALSLSFPVMASLVGFNAVFYSGLILVLLLLILRSDQSFSFVPWLALLIGLVRPDGVVIGFVAVLLVLPVAIRLGKLKKFSLNCLACLLCALCYFFWRYFYFQQLLPLPLIVKQHGNLPHVPQSILQVVPDFFLPLLYSLKGLGVQMLWLKSGWAISPLPQIALFFLSLFLNQDRFSRQRVALAILPLAALFLEFCFAVQLQNAYWRFQAPLLLGIYLLTFYSVCQMVCGRLLRPLLLTGLLVSSLPSVYLHASQLAEIKVHTNQIYINDFAKKLPQLLPPDARIAGTEAGILFYWLKGQNITDLVGLNTAYFADHVPDFDVLTNLQADLFMINHANLMDFKNCSDCQPLSEQIIKIPCEGILSLLTPQAQQALTVIDSSYTERRLENIYVAPLQTLAYLATCPAYEIYAVDVFSRRNYEHIYAFRRGSSWQSEVLAALQKSF